MACQINNRLLCMRKVAFDSLDVHFSPQINIIFGENGTGKSALLKVMYAAMKSIADVKNGKNELVGEKIESIMIDKQVEVLCLKMIRLAGWSAVSREVIVQTLN